MLSHLNGIKEMVIILLVFVDDSGTEVEKAKVAWIMVS